MIQAELRPHGPDRVSVRTAWCWLTGELSRGYPPPRTFRQPRSRPAGGSAEVVQENPVPHAGRVARPGHLEGHELAVVAHDRVGRLVAGVLVEICQTFPRLLAVERQLPDIDVAGPASREALAIGLDEGPLAVGKDPLRLVVLVGRIGVVDDLLCLQVDSTDIRTVVPVGREDQLALWPRPEVLALERAPERQVATVEDEPPVDELGRSSLVGDVGLEDPRAASTASRRGTGPRPASRRCAFSCERPPVLRSIWSRAGPAAWSSSCPGRKGNTARGSDRDSWDQTAPGRKGECRRWPGKGRGCNRSAGSGP